MSNTCKFTCTCESPPVIDLTGSFTGEADESSELLLSSTLSRWGWCHVAVDPSSLSCSFVKPDFVKFFEQEEIESLQQQGGAIYRGRSAESGSSASEQAEPKQSWEVQRCGDSTPTPLHDYMNVLHSIAVTVTKLLCLPENTVLQEGACSCCDGDCAKCNIDLMRVFLYDPAHPTLGSSAHTDWGSWTVVWQDGTGGLQTYCPEHERYVDVKAHQNDSKVYFVVHVGDVTSLAFGHASKEGTKVAFPSPKHRVICPREAPRVSLVYFAYPPPSISLADIERRLENHSILNDSKVSYGSYYLLQNQTPGGHVEDPETVYQSIRTKRLSEVFRAKWEQVQRSSY
jgi:hypothetical protein